MVRRMRASELTNSLFNVTRHEEPRLQNILSIVNRHLQQLYNIFIWKTATVWRSMSTKVDGIQHWLRPSFSLADYFDDFCTFWRRWNGRNSCIFGKFFSHLLANVWRSMSTRVDGIRHKMLPSFSLADYFDDIRTFWRRCNRRNSCIFDG
jgi:hypothetical protein